MDFRLARVAARLTQFDVRIRTGVNQTKISHIERGYLVPSEKDKQLLAKAVNRRPDEINWPEQGMAKS